MSHKVHKEEDAYYLAHNNLDVFQYDHSPLDHEIETGQPHLETFATKEELKARVEELGQVWRDPYLPMQFESVEEFKQIGYITHAHSGQTITIDDILE